MDLLKKLNRTNQKPQVFFSTSLRFFIPMQEIWKDIPWYEWLYQVSNFGRVFSIWTKPSIKSRGRLFPWRKWKILKWRQTGNYWHLSVRLARNWFSKDVKIHRIVASAFLWLDLFWFTDAKKSFCVCHKDDNPKNNNVENLFLWTNKDNHLDMMSKWRRVFPNWCDVYNSKFSEDEILDIREKFRNGIKQKEIAKIYKTTQQHISLICRRKIYSYVGDRNVAEQSWINNASIFLN